MIIMAIATFQLKPPKPYTISQEALDAILAEPSPIEPRRPEPQAAQQADKNGFKPVKGATGKILYILKKEATHPDSMKLLSEAGLRPMTYQELLPLLMEDEQLRNTLKGKLFWIAGQGMNKNGIFTIDEKGELVPLPQGFFKKKTSVEQKVRVFSGNQPLSFGVDSDYGAADLGRRFNLLADVVPQFVAPVVVGVLI